MNQIELINQKWLKTLIRQLYIGVLIIFFIEVYVCVYEYREYASRNMELWFVMRFLIVPTVFNCVCVMIARLVVASPKASNVQKNYTVAIIYSMICGCVQIAHYIFTPVLCVPIISIFITSIIGDAKLTRLIGIISYCTTAITYIVAMMELRRGDAMFIYDVLVAAVVIASSFILSKIFLRKEEERTNLIISSYESSSKMLYELQHDYLTGLHNRKAFFNTLEYIVDTGKDVCLGIIDLDDFKMINDTYGHPAGDVVLSDSARIMKRLSSGSIFIGRIGGEEFGVIFINMSSELSFLALERMRKDVEKHIFRIPAVGKRMRMTFSAGLVLHNKTESIQQLYKRADAALYKAKENGKNKVVINRG